MAMESPRPVTDLLSFGISRLRRRRFVVVGIFALLLVLVVAGVATWQQAAWLLAFAMAGVIAPLADDQGVARAPADGGPAAPTGRLIESLISGLPDAVIVLDRAGHIVAWNSAALKIAPSLAAGAALSLALRSADLIAAVRRVAAENKSERIEFNERVPIDTWWETHIVPISLAEPSSGRREFIVLTLHDLAPLRRVEEMRTNFVANVSHELRTPLASLFGFIETLQGPARDDPAARDRFLAIMKEQAMRMKRLIDDLLSLSRAELGASVQPDQVIDVVSVVRQVADGLRPLAQDRNVEIKIEARIDPLTVRGDHDELIRVFENLVENALKYGGIGKLVEITIARGGDGIARIAVRDYGPGIAREHLPRLTERFYRVDVTESRAQGGTGLGLALVKHVLNRHRGRLTIESEPGEGAVFTVELPEVAENQPN
jgi:two-component system phosphate regulon sensor histidine kinase PhoR